MTDVIATSQVIATTVLVLAPLLWVASHIWGLVQSRKALVASRQDLMNCLEERHKLSERLCAFLADEAAVNTEMVQSLAQAQATCREAMADSGNSIASAEVDLTEALGKCLQSLQETYGDIDEGEYVAIRNEALDVEDKVTAARDRYNALAASYNGKQALMPARLFAARLGHKPEMELDFEDTFLRFPLKFKATMPSKESMFLRDFGVIGEDESK